MLVGTGGISLLSDLLYSVNAVAPVFIMVILGYILNKLGLVDKTFTGVAEKLVFKLALPAMLFLNIADARFSGGDSAALFFYCTFMSLATLVGIALLAPIFVRDKVKLGAVVQGSWRSNFAILGVPLAANMFGSDGTAAVAIVMPIVIILYNSLSVVILSVCAPSDKKQSALRTLKLILKNIITNPLIIAVVLALPFMLLEIELPTVADKTLTYCSDLATPLALIVLGADFKLDSLKGKFGISLAAAIVKVAVVPAAAVTVAALIGFRGVSLGTIFVLFAGPTAVSSYIMAKNMGSDHEIASHILLISTFLCVFTIFIGVFLLKSLSLI